MAGRVQSRLEELSLSGVQLDWDAVGDSLRRSSAGYKGALPPPPPFSGGGSLRRASAGAPPLSSFNGRQLQRGDSGTVQRAAARRATGSDVVLLDPAATPSPGGNQAAGAMSSFRPRMSLGVRRPLRRATDSNVVLESVAEERPESHSSRRPAGSR